MSSPLPAAQHNPFSVSEIFRSKLFSLDQQSNKWVDKGIGYPKIVQMNNSKEGYLLKFFLDGNKAEILSEILGNDLIIENPKEKQITFSNDIKEEDIALSFEQDAGRVALWKQIKEAKIDMNQQQQENEFQSYRQQLEQMDEINSSYLLPLPSSVACLDQFLSILSFSPSEDKNVISSELMIRQATLFKGFKEQFSKAEKDNDQSALKALFGIFKELVFFAEHELLQLLLNNENYLLTFGILEYDEETKSKRKESHREFFQKRAKLLTTAQFRDVSKLDEIHFCFRLQYLRDVALAHVLDDQTLSIINIIASRINKGIVIYMLNNREIMSQLSSALGQKDYNALCQVHEMFLSVKTMDIFLESQTDIYETFNGLVIFDILESFLRNYDKPNQGGQMISYGFQRKKQQVLDSQQLERVPQMIVQILIQYMTNKPFYLLDYMSSNEQKFQGYSFFQLMCDEMMLPRHPSNQLYFSDLIRAVLENSLKDSSYSIFIDQFTVVHLSKMLEIFFGTDYSEESNCSRFLLIDLLVYILNLSESLSTLSSQALSAFVSLPLKMVAIFKTSQKCLCSSVLRLLTAFIDSEKQELHEALKNCIGPIVQFIITKIKNKGNLIYSESIKFIKMAHSISALSSELQETHSKFEENKVYQQFIIGLRKTIPPESSSAGNGHTSLFNSDNVKISLDSHKKYDNIIDGEEVDIDFIRKGSPPKSSPVKNSKQSKFSVEQEEQNENEDQIKDVIRKKFKQSPK